jgi:hypothetical protein
MTENQLIREIAIRASQLILLYAGKVISPAFIENEVYIVHHDICRLRLKDLLEADVGNFSHDISGIHENLDILNASFRNGFTPRFTENVH